MHDDDEMLDVPGASRSVLDQVDEYLHEDNHRDDMNDSNNNDNNDDNTLQVKHSTGSPSLSHWDSNTIEDLDNLSHSLFEQPNGDKQLRRDVDPINIPNKDGIVRPDMVFSPISSPMVMPTRSTSLGTYDTPFMLPQNSTASGPNTTTTTPFLNPSMTSNSSTSLSSLRKKSGKHGGMSQFSPLSSPALTAIDQAQIVNFALPESSIGSLSKVNSNSSRSKKKHYSSATAKVSKSSPRMKPAAASNTSRRQYTAEQFKNSSPVMHTDSANNAWDDAIFKLPESSIDDRGSSKWHQDEPTPKSSSSGGPQPATTASPDSRMTPVALMNYPKVILPSTSKPGYRNDESISPSDLGPSNSANDSERVLRATESPVIKPKLHHHHHQETAWKPNTRPAFAPKIDEVQEPRLQDPRPATQKSVSSSSLGGGNGSSDDGELSKKEVHKVAEQGRRNRLNTALTDLSSLLPPELKDSIPIPSKATTVELACAYIRQLLAHKNASNKA